MEQSGTRTARGPAPPALRVDLDRLQYRTLVDFACDVLRRNITSGVLAPGNRLVEREVATQLDISRIPVREATRRLAEEGLVDLHPHGRGAVVSDCTDERLREFFEVRTGLESWAAYLAARRRDPHALEELEATYAEGLASAEAGDFTRSRELGMRWHHGLARASGNTRLAKLLEWHDEKLTWRSQEMVSVRGTSTWAEHRVILDALQWGDSLAAAQAVLDHMGEHERAGAVTFSEDGDEPAEEV